MSGHICTLDSLLAAKPDATVGDLETEQQRTKRLKKKAN